MYANSTRATRSVAAAVASALFAAGLGLATTASAEDAKQSFEIYGFAQADAIYDFGRMNPDWDDAFRPSKIANPAGIYGSDGQASVSVKQSRFGVKGTMPTSEGHAPIDFKFEFDLFGVGADAGQTTFRLRHAYGEWGSLLAGQTNSIFMDIDVFPNVIDYWGPNGMVFWRNVQIRWTPWKTESSSFAVGIEEPSNDIDPGQIREFDSDAGRGPPERREGAQSRGALAHEGRLGPRAGRRHPARPRLRYEVHAEQQAQGQRHGLGREPERLDQRARAATRSCCSTSTVTALRAT